MRNNYRNITYQIWHNWVRSLPQNMSRNIIKKFTKSKLLRSYPEHVKCENIYCIECHRRQLSHVCVTSSISLILFSIYIYCPVPVTRYLFNIKVRQLHLRSFCHPVRPGSAQKTFGRKLIFSVSECFFLLYVFFCYGEK